jgi:hypothetical protein
MVENISFNLAKQETQASEPKKSPIDESLESQRISITQIGGAVQALRRRLVPVLKEGTQTVQEDATISTKKSCCPLADEIESNSQSLAYINGMVMLLLEDLAL